MKRIVKKYYSRGNVGATSFDNKALEELADRVERLLKKGHSPAYIVTRRLNNLPDGVSAEYTENSVILKDINLDADSNSWGCDKVEIIVFKGRTLAEQLIAEAEAVVEDGDIWEVEEYDYGDDALFWGFFFGQEEIEDEISGAELKERIQNFVGYVEEVKEQPDGIGHGKPITLRNPYGWGYEGWEYEFFKDTFTLKNYYFAPCGGEDYLAEEYIILRKKSDQA